MKEKKSTALVKAPSYLPLWLTSPSSPVADSASLHQLVHPYNKASFTISYGSYGPMDRALHFGGWWLSTTTCVSMNGLSSVLTFLLAVTIPTRPALHRQPPRSTILLAARSSTWHFQSFSPERSPYAGKRALQHTKPFPRLPRCLLFLHQRTHNLEHKLYLSII